MRSTVQPITPNNVIIALNLFRLMSLIFHLKLNPNLFHILVFSINPSLFILGGFAFRVSEGDSLIMLATANYEHKTEPITINRATKMKLILNPGFQ